MSMENCLRIVFGLLAIILLAALAMPAAFAEQNNHAAKIGHPVPNPNPSVRPAATINGTGLVHAHSGPSAIGGPAKTISGINGTAIRPKR
jgi:hypothetical protein